MSVEQKRIDEVKRELAQMLERTRQQAEGMHRGSMTWALRSGYANAIEDVLASLEHGTSVDAERSARAHREADEHRSCR